MIEVAAAVDEQKDKALRHQSNNKARLEKACESNGEIPLPAKRAASRNGQLGGRKTGAKWRKVEEPSS